MHARVLDETRVILDIYQSTNTQRREERRTTTYQLRPPATQFEKKNNFAVGRNPISQTYKLKPQTTALQKYKQGGGRLSAFYTYSHKQIFIIKIISQEKVIIDL